MTKIDTAPTRGLIAARAEAPTATAAEVAERIEKSFAAFKQKNDERLAQLQKGVEDAVTRDEVEKINAEVSKLLDDMRGLARQSAASRIGGSGDGDPDLEARRFSALAGQAVSPEQMQDYRHALFTALRRGDSMRGEIRASLQVGVDTDGGYIVPPTISDQIVTRVRDFSPMRQIASVETIGSDRLQGIRADNADSGEWVGETAETTDETTPRLGIWEIPVHTLAAKPKATQQMLDDAMWNVERWLINEVSQTFAKKEGAAFFTGDGVARPRGLLTYQTAETVDSARNWGVFQHVTTTNNDLLDEPDDLIDVVFSLHSTFRANARWVFNRATHATIRKMKDGQNNYLWQPDFTRGDAGLLLGYPVTEAEDMPDVADGALALAFGDFAACYKVVDRIGLRVLRDPYTSKPFVMLYTTHRVGGGVVNFEAVKFLKIQ